MAELDLTKYEEQNTPGVNNAEHASVDNNGNTDDNGIILYGPLSNVYAKALQEVLKSDTMISTESVFMQTAHMQDQTNTTNESVVVYVTDRDHIERDAVGEFDGLRLALDQKTAGKRYVVVEGMQNGISSKAGLILNYAKKNSHGVFYGKSGFLARMQHKNEG